MFDSFHQNISQRSRKVFGNKLRAVVIDNKDPEKRGRVKIRRRDIDDGISNEDLAWAMPSEGYGSGGKDVGKVDVPPINAEVFVDHQDESLYHPQYSQGPSTDNKKIDELTDADYPHKVGHQDRAGNISINNYKTGNSSGGGATAGEGGGSSSQDKNEMTRTHASGTTAFIDTDGNVTVTSAKQITINVNGPASIIVKEKVEIHSKQEIEIRAPKVNINNGSPKTPTEAKKRKKPQLTNFTGKTSYG